MFEPKDAYKELCEGLWGKQSRHHRRRGPGAGLTVAVERCRSTEVGVSVRTVSPRLSSWAVGAAGTSS